jgi:hypothetical protein
VEGENERRFPWAALQALLYPGLRSAVTKRLTSAPGSAADTVSKQRTPTRCRIHKASHTRRLQGYQAGNFLFKEREMLCCPFCFEQRTFYDCIASWTPDGNLRVRDIQTLIFMIQDHPISHKSVIPSLRSLANDPKLLFTQVYDLEVSLYPRLIGTFEQHRISSPHPPCNQQLSQSYPFLVRKGPQFGILKRRLLCSFNLTLWPQWRVCDRQDVSVFGKNGWISTWLIAGLISA